ncbi:helix-turn-helix domain-containing protein [Clostridium guangxiense]|uniref:helix-turn-helix domain-containing protein n=1 Tax=Clostridium guangxiense TaxID=1662055 RepID=UPI001E50B938|nr:helix-turn-helix transcriptional regulator [Clostridium guangxiense]MCD2346175.1 helix-turn-helix domain-containing protein [Clostridium guangxiense]
MENCTVLTDGDKLKNIRKKYVLKQEEISGSAITRNLISEIETNKATITKNTAEIIIKNLALLAKERHFQFTETVEYLLENETMQANKIVNHYINELKSLNISKDGNFTTKLKEIESFLLKYDIPDKKIIIYELAGDYYCNKNEMSKSVIYYEKAITLTGKLTLSNTSLTLLRKLSMVYGYLGRYKESIECC